MYVVLGCLRVQLFEQMTDDEIGKLAAAIEQARAQEAYLAWREGDRSSVRSGGRSRRGVVLSSEK